MTSPQPISFTHLEIAPRSVTVLATTEEFALPLEFSFDRELPVSSSMVGLALATLCGDKFGRVLMDFEVTEPVAREISTFTKAALEASVTGPACPKGYRTGNVLSFSGGFDSLASLALMPKDTHLVSLDFGGWFEREAGFFKRFDTLVVQTNVRMAPHPRRSLVLNHWSFMAIGALLTTDYFGARYHSFGNILGETFATPNGPPATSLSLLDCAGYTAASYTAGLTELGAARVAMQAFPDLISDSIASLAAATDRKRLLKTAMSHLIRELHGLDADLPPLPDKWDSPIPFADSYTTALGYLHFVGKDRADLLRPLFNDVPDWTHELSGRDEFGFHERFNVDYYRAFPEELWPGLQSAFAGFGLRPYGELEYTQAARARRLLNREFGKPVLSVSS